MSDIDNDNGRGHKLKSMKTIFNMYSAMMAMLLMLVFLASCTDEDVTTPEADREQPLVEVILGAGMDTDSSNTPAGVAQGGIQYSTIANANSSYEWIVGDSIAVWPLDANGNVATGKPYKFRVVTVKEDPSKCLLSGRLPASYENSRFAALYPYQEDAECSRAYSFNVPYIDLDNKCLSNMDVPDCQYEFKATVPTLQQAVENSYDPKAYLSLAVMQKADEELSFKNACTLIKITAPATAGDVKSITLSTRDNPDLDNEIDYLTGRYKMGFAFKITTAPQGMRFNDNMSEAEKSSWLIPNMRAVRDVSNTVTIAAPEGQTLKAGGVYYMVVRNFRSHLFEKMAILPPTGGNSHLLTDDPSSEYYGWYYNKVWNWQDVNMGSPVVTYTDTYREFTYAEGLKEATIIAFAGSPMLRSGHVLTFVSRSGQKCERKFKASERTEDARQDAMFFTPSHYQNNNWYKGILITRTISSGHDFKRNAIKEISYTDEASKYKWQ